MLSSLPSSLLSLLSYTFSHLSCSSFEDFSCVPWDSFGRLHVQSVAAEMWIHCGIFSNQLFPRLPNHFLQIMQIMWPIRIKPNSLLIPDAFLVLPLEWGKGDLSPVWVDTYYICTHQWQHAHTTNNTYSLTSWIIRLFWLSYFSISVWNSSGRDLGFWYRSLPQGFNRWNPASFSFLILKLTDLSLIECLVCFRLIAALGLA